MGRCNKKTVGYAVKEDGKRWDSISVYRRRSYKRVAQAYPKGYTLLTTLIGMAVILFLVGQSVLFAEGRNEVLGVIQRTSNTPLLAGSVAKERVKQISDKVNDNQAIILSQLWNYCRKEPIQNGKLAIEGKKLSLLSRGITYMLLVEWYTEPMKDGSRRPDFMLWNLPQYDYVYQSELLGEGQRSRVDTTIVFRGTVMTSSTNPEDHEMRRLTDDKVIRSALKGILNKVDTLDVKEIPNQSILQHRELAVYFEDLEKALDRVNQCMVYTQVRNTVKEKNVLGNLVDRIYDQCRMYTTVRLVGNEGAVITMEGGVLQAEGWLVQATVAYQKEERKP